MLPVLLRPEGGYDYGAIQAVFGINGISAEAQRNLLPTIIDLIGVIEAERRKQRPQA